MSLFTVEGARVFLPDQIVETCVTVENGLIVEIGEGKQGKLVDGRGHSLAPAMIDIHGDAFERQLMPRPGVFFPLEAAALETDRQLASNGIATAYHAVTLSWEPGLRSIEMARRLIEALARLAPRLTVENHVQLRWETFCFEAIDLIEDVLSGPLMPSIAFNDHTSMAVLHPDLTVQTRPFDHVEPYPVADLDSDAFKKKMQSRAERSGLSIDDFVKLVKGRWQMRPDVPSAIEHVASLARAKGAAMLSHDDSQAQTRSYYRDLGVTVSEFPMSNPVALAARQGGDQIVFGAPNAVRGGSHLGSSPCAGDMIEAGLCDILASDYYYPAMLAGIAKLDEEKRADRLALWRLVSSGPAEAMKLSDRGEIAVGKRADLVLIDWPEGHMPSIRTTWVAGRTAYDSRPAG